MRENRRKIRICLMIVVAMAVIVGCIYYFVSCRDDARVSEGTLVRTECSAYVG